MKHHKAMIGPIFMLCVAMLALSAKCVDDKVNLPIVNDHFKDCRDTVTNYKWLRKAHEIPWFFTKAEMDTTIIIAQKLSIPQYMAFNLIHEESRFDSTANNGLCSGFCGLNYKYFTWTNSIDNIWNGFAYLKNLYLEYRDWETAINMYNSNHPNGSRQKYVDYILYNNR